MKYALLVTAACSVVLAGCGRLASATDCPSVESLRSYRPPEATRLYARDGSLLADLSVERRTVVDLDEIPPAVSNGIVAVEDRRFWTHGGIDPRGVVRAVWRDLVTLSLREGFSTITMQLARNVFPDELPRADRLRRKSCEVLLAGRIEATFPKREILRMYINQVYMGDGMYGMEEAARGYFGKTARRLTTAESALLVGLVKNPEGYNPRRNVNRAIQRRNVVLDVMARENVITAADAAKAKAEPVAVTPPLEAAGPAPYYVAAVRRELRERFGTDAPVLGFRVHTGLDPVIQRAARSALVDQIRDIEGVRSAAGRTGNRMRRGCRRQRAAAHRTCRVPSWCWTRRPARSGRWLAAATSRTRRSTAHCRRGASPARRSSPLSTRRHCSTDSHRRRGSRRHRSP
jgi:penicillin-binding protein 1A